MKNPDEAGYPSVLEVMVMPEKKDKGKKQGGWVNDEFVCAHCLTEEDEKALKKVLSEDEKREASQYLCSRCNKDAGN